MKLCIVCKEQILTTKHKSQKYCSRVCYFNDKFETRSFKIVCLGCKRIAISYPSNPKKYCSRQCYYNAPKSEDFKRKISEAFRGSNHPNWKGGIMKGRKDRNLAVYKNWRSQVFARDHYTCVWCGVHNEKGLGHTVQLEADHIESWTDHPELRYEVDNGRTLCKDCHTERTAQQHRERMRYATV